MLLYSVSVPLFKGNLLRERQYLNAYGDFDWNTFDKGVRGAQITSNDEVQEVDNGPIGVVRLAEWKQLRRKWDANATAEEVDAQEPDQRKWMTEQQEAGVAYISLTDIRCKSLNWLKSVLLTATLILGPNAVEDECYSPVSVVRVMVDVHEDDQAAVGSKVTVGFGTLGGMRIDFLREIVSTACVSHIILPANPCETLDSRRRHLVQDRFRHYEFDQRHEGAG